MTERKRPWTEGPLDVFPVAKNTSARFVAKAEPDGVIIAKFASKADARLFAAAPAMYEVLYAAFMAGDLSPIRWKEAEAALRAANPDAFESEGE